MKKNPNEPHVVNSISELHRLSSLPKPEHPLISFINHADVKSIPTESANRIVLNFYNVSVKKDFKGVMKYGKNYYDFDEGSMSFVSPGQTIAVDDDQTRDRTGWSLMFHPDLIRNYPLGKLIKSYGFFLYDVNEALHLSGKEEAIIESIIENIRREYDSSIDSYSQDVMVSQLDSLLVYANRFYNRQFITRKTASSDLLAELENLLTDYFDNEKDSHSGLPTVRYVAERLNVSPNYLSDMLRMLTGQNTQQHIHNKLIEKTKEALTTTSLSVGESLTASALNIRKHSTNYSRARRICRRSNSEIPSNKSGGCKFGERTSLKLIFSAIDFD